MELLVVLKCSARKAVPIASGFEYGFAMNIVLSIMMLAAIALLLGAFLLWRKGGPKQQVLMMILLAVIAAVNIAIWTVPDAEGTAPLDKLDQADSSED